MAISKKNRPKIKIEEGGICWYCGEFNSAFILEEYRDNEPKAEIFVCFKCLRKHYKKIRNPSVLKNYIQKQKSRKKSHSSLIKNGENRHSNGQLQLNLGGLQ